MAISDPVSDFLTKVRNASSARKGFVEVKSSRLIERMAQILTEEGYVSTVKVVEELPQKKIRLELKYDQQGKGAITEIRRVSRPSRRIYRKAKDIPKVLGGLGVSIVTTSRGLMTDRQARRENVGGEVICHVW